jgi:hypothetical protein
MKSTSKTRVSRWHDNEVAASGRIRSFERETDDSVAILGADLEIQAAHSQGVRNTEQ